MVHNISPSPRFPWNKGSHFPKPKSYLLGSNRSCFWDPWVHSQKILRNFWRSVRRGETWVNHGFFKINILHEGTLKHGVKHGSHPVFPLLHRSGKYRFTLMCGDKKAGRPSFDMLGVTLTGLLNNNKSSSQVVSRSTFWDISKPLLHPIFFLRLSELSNFWVEYDPPLDFQIHGKQQQHSRGRASRGRASAQTARQTWISCRQSKQIFPTKDLELLNYRETAKLEGFPYQKFPYPRTQVKYVASPVRQIAIFWLLLLLLLPLLLFCFSFRSPRCLLAASLPPSP